MFLSPTGNEGEVQETPAVFFVLTAVLMLLLMAACTPPVRHDHGLMSENHQPVAAEHPPQAVHETPVLDLGAVSDLESIIPRLADMRIVFVGETHDRYDHHLTQLEIIRRLHALHPRLAIGMEIFQQPFQDTLDDYVAGNLSEYELLRDTEYYQRWRFDFRHYAPILRYARKHGLPVIALNLPTELTRKVGRSGLENLTAEERARLPAEIDRSDNRYEDRLKTVFAQHPGNSVHGFENFLDVQLLWDEGMAEQAANYLKAHPDYTMVVLAGSGHLAYGSGIPNRLTRRLPVNSAIILNGWNGPPESDLADFLLLPGKRVLPAAGRFGVLLGGDDDTLQVDACLSDSPCETVGLKRGDRFISINGDPVSSRTDLRLAMWDKKPGETVTLRIQRSNWLKGPQQLSYEIKLR
jgi:uncharacterized iron-regulated protein